MEKQINKDQNIQQIPQESLSGIWEIVKSEVGHQKNDKELVFDIDKLSVKKARELESYIKRKQ
ncbi:hypothetical protein IMG5_201310 [Ichthyophthirius multifiliis]|uniref:NET domain-containing protein n=1 Tax=Ichthyophthirius multifiliis TaxID=5932 RepID=G0R5Y5_ICHMU|nr:hypothetical protein IMG5_201310 [Ichthyophthirius multifiliis]EGR27109.1 hypothetical protein IMG5_201310 [Ichthyophthirius multifiliis]|eukprot:XP_004023993.1 hypothetical protein IMG5_201310 [Ichthyophthirius multifiliis]